jgi:3,4-dihydroxy 2-butanone 4-phosphate synthase / GTP cyclohydrolase II
VSTDPLAPTGPGDPTKAVDFAAGTPQTRTAIMTTSYGPVEVHALHWPDEEPYVALRHLDQVPLVRLRLQAQCVTSTAFAAQMCDCRRQIEAGVRLTATSPGTVFIYLPQEGRGHGLLSKVEVMAAMNTGLSLTAAQEAVGRPQSRLSYHRVPYILVHYLGHRTPVVLITESTEKIRAARAAGIKILRTEGLPP